MEQPFYIAHSPIWIYIELKSIASEILLKQKVWMWRTKRFFAQFNGQPNECAVGNVIGAVPYPVIVDHCRVILFFCIPCCSILRWGSAQLCTRFLKINLTTGSGICLKDILVPILHNFSVSLWHVQKHSVSV